ncbi:MAG: hypothetical protein J6J36_07025 [Clostridia bacterium]|nr:hypothetical protein [Clostridia bacterium]
MSEKEKNQVQEEETTEVKEETQKPKEEVTNLSCNNCGTYIVSSEKGLTCPRCGRSFYTHLQTKEQIAIMKILQRIGGIINLGNLHDEILVDFLSKL